MSTVKPQILRDVMWSWFKEKVGLELHSSEKKVLGQLKNQEKCFKICYVYGKRKPT